MSNDEAVTLGNAISILIVASMLIVIDISLAAAWGGCAWGLILSIPMGRAFHWMFD